MASSPDDWRRVFEVFERVVALPAHDRAALVASACGNDRALRADVERMLDAHDKAAGFLSRAAALFDATRGGHALEGERIGPYQLSSRIGSGGMGVVYKAVDIRLDRTVAIKMLPEDTAGDASSRARFDREGRAIAALNHPNICALFDVGETLFPIREPGAAADAPQVPLRYLVMEYLDGESLADRLARGPLPLPVALDVAGQVATALDTAHRAGIVHRDLKPANVFLVRGASGRPTAKLLDFGLAKSTVPAMATASTALAANLTASGMIVGTLRYMSPEQVEGRDADARSDIFAFGAVLHEMLIGAPAFTGKSQAAVMAAILEHDPTPLSALLPSAPPALGRLVQKCLAKHPDERWQTSADLASELRWIAQNGAPPVLTPEPAQAPRRSLWKWAAAITVLLALVGGYFAARAWRSPAGEGPLQPIPLNTISGAKRSPSFSPDGNYMAFSWKKPGSNTDVYVQQIGAVGSPMQRTFDPAEDVSPVWSPDGSWIAFLRQRPTPQDWELRLVPPLQGPERVLTDIHLNSGHVVPLTLAWCPKSDCVVITDEIPGSKFDALFAVSVESREKTRLTSPPTGSYDREPALSPDGNWLVFRRSRGPFTGELYRQRLDKGLAVANDPVRLMPTGSYWYPKFMPDSREVLLSGRDPSGSFALWRLNISDRALTRLPFGEDGQMPAISASLPGRPSRLVYVHSFQDENILRVDTAAPGEPASSPPTVVISSTREDSVAALSPDGSRIAFISNRMGSYELWVANASGDNPHPLTSQHAGAGLPRWSPDSRWIVYQSDADNAAPDVFAISAAGGKPANLTIDNPTSFDSYPSFSTDGNWIYFSSGRSEGRRIWRLRFAEGKAVGPSVRVSTTPGFLALESKDERYVYYVESASQTEPGRLVRIPRTGGDPQKVIDGVHPSGFDVLEGGIYYVGKRTGDTQLTYYDFARRRSRVVRRDLGDLDFGLTASRDGRTIFYTRVEPPVDELMLVEKFR